jgi:hypothetical protein
MQEQEVRRFGTRSSIGTRCGRLRNGCIRLPSSVFGLDSFSEVVKANDADDVVVVWVRGVLGRFPFSGSGDSARGAV